jgi:hypothetical protein
MDINYYTTKEQLQKLRQKLYYREYYYNVIKKNAKPKKVKIINYDFDESSNGDDNKEIIRYKEVIASNVKVRIDDSQKFIVEF